MRIAIDARPVADHFPGIGRYVFDLLGALAALGGRHEVVALTCPSARNTRFDLRAAGVELFPVAAPPLSLAEQLAVPAALRALGADLYHATYYVRPYAGLPCPSVTTLYDIIPRRFPESASPRARALFDALHRLAARASRRLIAISEHARGELARAYAIDPARIDVTPLAAGPQFRPQPHEAVAAAREKLGLPERYALALASNKPHKNLAGLLRAWALLEEAGGGLPALVVAGHRDAAHPGAEELAARLGLAGVVARPDVGEADLPALYAGAELFVYPSLYEGFGLPPLEALACGAPVVCGSSSSLPEVVGGAALTADVADPGALAAAVRRALGDAGLRARLREAGPAQAARFSWRRTAEATVAAYERAAGT